MRVFIVQLLPIDSNILEINISKLDYIKYPYLPFIRKQLAGLGLKPKTISKINIAGHDSLVVFNDKNINIIGDFSQIKTDEAPREVIDEIDMYKKYILATSLVKEWHGTQKYSFLKLPYYYHLKQTEKVVDFFFWEVPAGKTIILKIASLLHDVLEDTSISAEEIQRLFGIEILDIVEKVTKVAEENTLDYETTYYKNIAKNPLAVYIKIADKCANTKQTVKYYSEWHAKRIIDGHPIFQHQTYEYIDSPFLKKYLDGLVNKLETYNGK